jgi:hypothetical protein
MRYYKPEWQHGQINSLPHESLARQVLFPKVWQDDIMETWQELCAIA